MENIKICLITGYKGSGKDTLYKSYVNNDTRIKWAVYQNQWKQVSFPNINAKRLAFADEVKKLVYQKLVEEGILNKEVNPLDDSLKEKVLKTGKTFRDYCIELSMGTTFGRSMDKDVWVKKVYQEMLDDVSTGNAFVITDWRFQNEKEFLLYKNNVSLTTVRVFRRCVPIPSIDDKTEHDLDRLRTDFLVLPGEDTESEYEAATKIFPQYLGYKRLF